MATDLKPIQAQKVVLYPTWKEPVEYEVLELDSIVFIEDEPSNKDEHEWVDFGLPSGTLWATCNVGADCPEEYGDYFAWGETKPKEDYSWETYLYCEGSFFTLTKYCTDSSYGYGGHTDSLTELLPEDDAATVNWGNEWRTPSLEQCMELRDDNFTTTTWTTLNGTEGIIITSNSNGNSIFLPAARLLIGKEYYDGSPHYIYGDYWSSTVDAVNPCNAYVTNFAADSIDYSDYRTREVGRSIRPVRKR